MIEVGRVCIKIAGREAKRKCVIVDIVDKNFVIIDGEVRRKRCNIKHLQLLPDKIKISKGAPHDEVIKIMKDAGIIKEEVKKATKEKKEKKERPKKKKVTKKTEGKK